MSTDANPPEMRLTVDEISPDQDNRPLARLVSDNGDQMSVALTLLPEGTRVGDVLVVSFRPDPDERKRRRQHIADLQRRLFGSG